MNKHEHQMVVETHDRVVGNLPPKPKTLLQRVKAILAGLGEAAGNVLKIGAVITPILIPGYLLFYDAVLNAFEPFWSLPEKIENIDEKVTDAVDGIHRVQTRVSALECEQMKSNGIDEQRVSIFDCSKSGIYGECFVADWCEAFSTVSRTRRGDACGKPEVEKVTVTNHGDRVHQVQEYKITTFRASLIPSRSEYAFFIPRDVKPGVVTLQFTLLFPCPWSDMPIQETSTPLVFIAQSAKEEK